MTERQRRRGNLDVARYGEEEARIGLVVQSGHADELPLTRSGMGRRRYDGSGGVTHRGYDGSLDGGARVYAEGDVIVSGGTDHLIRLELEGAVAGVGEECGG